MGKIITMRNIIYISLTIFFMSCICGGGKPTINPAYPTYKYLFIFNGESNSGGQALNSAASPSELGIKSNVQILNNTTSHQYFLRILRSHTITAKQDMRWTHNGNLKSTNT